MTFFLYLFAPLLALFGINAGGGLYATDAKNEEISPPYREIADQFPLKIVTPSLKDWHTAKIALANGLKVYLISDPLAEKSAAALQIKAGSWDEPQEHSGLAHFLEHMLFLGTQSYPQESEYDRYITEHGGLFNAYTASDRTAYLFSIDHLAFEPALDRFSSFFKEPLLNPSGISRELQAIDQEWAKNLNSNSFRMLYVLKTLANPKHPFSRFSCGSSHSLKNATQEDLNRFFKQHYNADLMHLVIYSPLPLDQLKQLAAHHFGPIKQTPQTPFQSQEPLLGAHLQGHMIQVEPVSETRNLSLIWELPPSIAKKIDSKPYDLIGFVIGHEGENSLLERLKAEGLADTIAAGGAPISTDNLLFTIDISLTEQGLQQKELVIKRVFQTIQRLKESSFPAYLFDEMTSMQQISYEYQQRDRAFSTVSDYIEKISDEDFASYPLKTLSISTLNQEDIQETLSLLTPSSAIYCIVAKGKEELKNAKDPWNQTSYGIQPVAENYLKGWESKETHPKILLPAKNPFIPNAEDLTLIQHQAHQSKQPPQLLIDEAIGKLYYKTDDNYLVPEVYLGLELYTPLTAQIDPREAVLVELFLKAWQDDLTAVLYKAHLGGLSLELGKKQNSLACSIYGYSKYAPLLLKEAFKRAKYLKPSADQFAIYKEALLRRYRNFLQENPLTQGFETLRSVLYQDFIKEQEKLTALEKITLEELSDYIAKIFNPIYLEGLFYGNLSEEAASDLWRELQAILEAKAYPLEQQRPIKVIVLPKDEGPHLIEQTSLSLGNAALLAIQDGPFSFKNRAAQQILTRALDEPFYTALRTKQQTAYIVYNMDQELEKQLFTFFAVQSNTHDGRDLLARFELFIEEFLQRLSLQEKETLEQFEHIKQALISELSHPPDNLKKQGSLYQTLAFHYKDFNWIETRLKALKELTFAEYADYTKALLGKLNKRRLAIAVSGKILGDQSLIYSPQAEANLKQKGAFKAKEE